MKKNEGNGNELNAVATNFLINQLKILKNVFKRLNKSYMIII